MTTNLLHRSMLFGALLLAPFCATSQTGPLKSQGEIPEEFRTLTASKVQKQQAETAKSNHNDKQKKRINEFLLQNNYVIDELLQSGKILFGDSLTRYVNDVAAYLLADDDVLLSELRFYVMKSNEVNAFATNQGIIFVTVGLLAQLENEGQLAAVLSHEIAHYEKAHSINKVLETDRVNSTTSNSRYNRKDSRMRLLSAFSRDMEFEADSLGFIRLVQRGYDEQAALSVLDVLQFKMLPIDDIPFEDTYLTLGLTSLPKSMKLDSLTPIPLFDDNEVDVDATHPNISKRRLGITEMCEENDKKGKKYQVSRDQFVRARSLAQHECIILDLAAQQYIDAFYDAFVVATKNGDNKELCEFRAMALYGIAKYKNAGELFDAGPTSEDVYSNIQGVYYFFEEIKKKECNLLVIRHLWDCYEKYNNPFIEKLLDNAIYELIDRHNVEYEDLLSQINKLAALNKTPDSNSTKTTEAAETKEEQDSEEDEEDSKFDRLRQKKEDAIQKSLDGESAAGMENAWEDHFVSQMFVSISRDALKTKFNAQKNAVEEAQKKEEAEEELSEYQRSKIKVDYDISKAVFVDPFYLSYDYRKGIRLIESEQANLKLVDHIETCSKTNGLDQVTLLTKEMESEQTADYNTMSLMNSWTQEHLAHEESRIKMIPLMTAFTRQLEEQYSTPYFVYTGTYSTTQERNTSGLWFYTCFLPVLLPITLALEATPVRNTQIYFMVFDVAEGKTVVASEYSSKGNTTDAKITTELNKQIKKIR